MVAMDESSSRDRKAIEKVRVWDLPTRIFHWTLVASIAVAYLTYTYSEALADPTLMYHRYTGYLILILVVWRLLWGIAGSETSRFSSFVRRPATAAKYTANLANGSDRHFLGHNPLGGYAVIAILAIVAAQGVLGLLTEEHNGVTWGPLYFLVPSEQRAMVTGWHHSFFYWGVLAIVGVHIAANAFHVVVKREPLVRAMVTGRKPKMDYADHDAPPKLASSALAFLLLGVAVAIVFGSIKLIGGRLFY